MDQDFFNVQDIYINDRIPLLLGVDDLYLTWSFELKDD